VQLSKFLSQIQKLKQTPRTGWLLSGIKHPESVSEHCFDVALITMLLADSIPQVNKQKAVTLALIHDLPEAITGDLVRGTDPQKQEKERAAMEKLLIPLPNLKTNYLSIWNSLSGDSPESNLVKLADNISMLLQAREYLSSDPDNPKLKEIESSASKSIKKHLSRL